MAFALLHQCIVDLGCAHERGALHEGLRIPLERRAAFDGAKLDGVISRTIIGGRP